jgi:hypothetical protein
MWLFTPFGFFSVVENRTNRNQLMVRSRSKLDLEAFVARIGRNTRIFNTPKSDYPFRIVVGKRTVRRVVAKFIMHELDYSNFKSEVLDRQSLERELVYSKVWSVLYGAFDREGNLRHPLARTSGALSTLRGLDEEVSATKVDPPSKKKPWFSWIPRPRHS